MFQLLNSNLNLFFFEYDGCFRLCKISFFLTVAMSAVTRMKKNFLFYHIFLKKKFCIHQNSDIFSKLLTWLTGFFVLLNLNFMKTKSLVFTLLHVSISALVSLRLKNKSLVSFCQVSSSKFAFNSSIFFCFRYFLDFFFILFCL